jgi:hypothetical protein
MSTSPNPTAALQLPIRADRIIVPAAGPGTISLQEAANNGSILNTTQNVSPSDYEIKATLKPFTDYIVFRIPHRGTSASGAPDTTQPAYFRFLVNPRTVQISHQMQDTELLTRDGWKFGVWGEAFTPINFSGKTAGQYFSLGLTDMFKEFTDSYQNLLELQSIFDNNGYWFEGETPATGSSPGQNLPATISQRRIKIHQDVEVLCGEKIWSGMFDKMVVSQSADSPYLSDFTISFTAWKERYITASPYINMGECNLQRGHTYNVFDNTAAAQGQNQIGTSVTSAVGGVALPTTAAAYNPAVQAATAEQATPPITPSQTYSPTTDILNPTDSFWNSSGLPTTPTSIPPFVSTFDTEGDD